MSNIDIKDTVAHIKNEFLLPIGQREGKKEANDGKETTSTNQQDSEKTSTNQQDSEKTSTNQQDSQKTSTNQQDSEKTSEPPHKKQKLTGTHKHRPKLVRAPKSAKLCRWLWCLEKGEEATCPYPKCEFLHDINAYIKTKPPDLGAVCHNYRIYGRCHYGVVCRFGGDHIEGERNRVERRPDGLNAPAVANTLKKEVQHLLRKRQYDFSKAIEANRQAQSDMARKSNEGKNEGGTMDVVGTDVKTTTTTTTTTTATATNTNTISELTKTSKVSDEQTNLNTKGDSGTSTQHNISTNANTNTEISSNTSSKVSDQQTNLNTKGDSGTSAQHNISTNAKTNTEISSNTSSKVSDQQTNLNTKGDSGTSAQHNISTNANTNTETKVIDQQQEDLNINKDSNESNTQNTTSSTINTTKDIVTPNTTKHDAPTLENGSGTGVLENEEDKEVKVTVDAGAENPTSQHHQHHQQQHRLGPASEEDLVKPTTAERRKNTIDWRSKKTYLAPLTTLGNLPFRRICKQFGVDVTCGEMALATNLLQGLPSEWALVKKHSSEDCFGIQLCGSNPLTMTKCTQLLDENVDFDFMDINMGCPIDLIYKQGGGSALMRRHGCLEHMVRGMTKVLTRPLTLKMRTAVYHDTKVAHTLIQRAKLWDVSMVTVHGRSKEQRYLKLADWNYVGECVKAGDSLPVFGNGDVLSYEDYNHCLNNTGVTGIMVARGALIKPWVFKEIKEQRHWDIRSSERLDMLRDFTNYGMEHWGSDNEGVEKTRRFLLEWLSFLHRYVPVGLLESTQKINQQPPAFIGRDELETLMASRSVKDWIKISEMLLGPVPPDFAFLPKHKANAY